MEEFRPLLRICTLLNEAGARYLVIGGYACILHGLLRTTNDVDILIEESFDNFQRVLTALGKLEDGAAKELSPADLQENLVVKVADEVEVDVSTRAWKVSYAEAAPHAQQVEFNGVSVPFLGINDLINSKSTHREQDQIDVLQLRAIQQQRKQP
jgi:hypothetical protein